MKHRRVVAAAISLLVAFGMFGAACGGGDEELTLAEYFQRFEAINLESNDEIDALFDDVPQETDEEFEADEANLPVAKDLMAGLPRVLGVALAAYEELSPRSEAAEAHDELLEAGSDLVAVFQEIAEEVEGAETMAEVMQSTTNAEGSGATGRVSAACVDLIDIASANDITVDGSCGLMVRPNAQ